MTGLVSRVGRNTKDIRHRVLSRSRRRRLPWLPIIFLTIFVLSGLMAPWLSPHDPYEISLNDRLTPPGTEFLAGTDALGRDLLSRLFYGARVSLSVVAVSLLVSVTVGTVLGTAAGYFGGKLDSVIARVIDLLLAFPSIFFGLLFATSIGAGMGPVILAVSLVVWARFARVIRSEVVSIRERDFVSQARIIGCSPVRILAVHIFPSIVGTLMVLIAVNTGFIVLLESVLSYLGAGIPPPSPSWGSMISDGQHHIRSAWWLTVLPGVLIMLTVLSVNVLGDWLRERLDPTLRNLGS